MRYFKCILLIGSEQITEIQPLFLGQGSCRSKLQVGHLVTSLYLLIGLLKEKKQIRQSSESSSSMSSKAASSALCLSDFVGMSCCRLIFFLILGTLWPSSPFLDVLNNTNIIIVIWCISSPSELDIGSFRFQNTWSSESLLLLPPNTSWTVHKFH